MSTNHRIMKNLKYMSYLWKLDWISTLRFNFHYFKFKDAAKLPVFLYKTKIVALKGKVILTQPAKPGMIKLGMSMVPIFQSKYNFIYENLGG